MWLHVGDMPLLAYSPPLRDIEHNFCLNETIIWMHSPGNNVTIFSTCDLRIYMCFNACTGMSMIINCCKKGCVLRYNDSIYRDLVWKRFEISVWLAQNQATLITTPMSTSSCTHATKDWFIVGPLSRTSAKHCSNIGSMSHSQTRISWRNTSWAR